MAKEGRGLEIVLQREAPGQGASSCWEGGGWRDLEVHAPHPALCRSPTWLSLSCVLCNKPQGVSLIIPEFCESF